MEHCVIVEFVGIAGCGKTTRAGNLVSSFRNKGADTWFRREQPRFRASILPAVFTRPAPFVRWLTDGKRKQILSQWRRLAPAGQVVVPSPAAWWVWMDLWWLFAARVLRRSQAAVFDEGVLQHSVSAYGPTGFEPAAVREFVRAYGRYAGLTLVVVVQPPVPVCLDRMASRDRVPERLRGMDAAGLKEHLERDALCMEALTRALGDAGVRHIRIPGMDLEQDMKAIVSATENTGKSRIEME